MKIFKIFWNFEQEEKWLDEMAANGHILKSYSILGIYTFTDGAPQQLTYKIDYKMFSRKADFISYVTLFEDAGWQHVWGTKHSGNQYFLSKSEQAGTDIFSDVESASTRYKTQFHLCLVSAVLLVAYCVSLLYTNDFCISGMIFLTPGLWEKTDVAFWKSFLFELPFAIGRVAIWAILLVMVIAYGYWTIRTKQEYDRQTSKHEEDMK